ncbi:hypothetical protein T484DRAFT_1852285 [Baffinella frigidus]|nr:hypothetical protein T484DRAFT_1852285 [Cryptophyta sp. CCMP2293]
MSLDTIICSNYTASKQSKSTTAHYRIGHLPMHVFGVGSYGMGSVLAAMGAANLEEDEDHHYITELSARATHKTCATTPEELFCLQAGLVTSASRTSHGSNEMGTTMATFRSFMQLSYTEDGDLLMRNILASGRLCYDGRDNDNHAAYMVARAWLWEMHSKTFMSSMAPYVACNSSFQDLLTLLSVVTYNHLAPIERLWDGKLSITCMQTERASLRAKEATVWRNLLAEFGVTSKEVVHYVAPEQLSRLRPSSAKYSPAAFRREETTTGHISPYFSTPHSPCTPLAGNTATTCVSLSTFAAVDAGTTKRYRFHHQAERVQRKKNIWLDEAFKTHWHTARAKLHHHDYGTVSGISGTAADYGALAGFVVSSFAKGLSANDEMVAKCAPQVGGVYDKCTKGVLASNGVGASKLPVCWGVSGGITNAIAHMMYSDLLDQRMAQDAAVGAIVVTTEAQKGTIMAMYKSRVCADKS